MNSLNILVVSGIQLARHSLVVFLKSLGHSAVEVFNIDQALNVIRVKQVKFDVLIVDFDNENSKNDMALLEAVRNHDPNIRLYARFGSDAKDIVSKAKNLGVVCMSKMTTPDRMLEILSLG